MGTVFQLSNGEAKKTASVVSGMFLLNFMPTRILFNFARVLKIFEHTFSNALVIEIANGEQTITCEVVANCHLEIEGDYFEIDLLPMAIGSFDVVICID
ncbi:hypothetical protein OSB04_un001863 [Centaurea solstitialis]|uniref:Uncharacterized protein n=1 Tax=Centaurea solstitialis TaxID=347529 RepID=A0AA38S2K9_9ASTR|nr:hypothetical protein OSB04_un001863 [Centaurea solstitialis]